MVKTPNSLHERKYPMDMDRGGITGNNNNNNNNNNNSFLPSKRRAGHELVANLTVSVRTSYTKN